MPRVGRAAGGAGNPLPAIAIAAQARSYPGPDRASCSFAGTPGFGCEALEECRAR